MQYYTALGHSIVPSVLIKHLYGVHDNLYPVVAFRNALGQINTERYLGSAVIQYRRTLLQGSSSRLIICSIV